MKAHPWIPTKKPLEIPGVSSWRISGNPVDKWSRPEHALLSSAQTDLGEDALAGEQFGGEADDKTQHGQAAIPGFSERNKTKAGGGVSHGWLSNVAIIIKDCEALGVGLTEPPAATGQLSCWIREAASGQVAERPDGGLWQRSSD